MVGTGIVVQRRLGYYVLSVLCPKDRIRGAAAMANEEKTFSEQ